jgi:hypothetical protein
MVIDTVAMSVAALGLTGVVAWATTRHYRNQITSLLRELEEARAAAAHHALWSEEQRIELGRQVRTLQSQVARLEALMQNEQKRSSRSSWSLPIVTPGTTAAAAGPQPRAINLAATIPGLTPHRPLVQIDGGRPHAVPALIDEVRADVDDEHDLQLDNRRDTELAPRTGAASGKVSPTGEHWREPQVAATTGYFSSRTGRLTIPTGGITTATEFDFAATQPIDVRELHNS